MGHINHHKFALSTFRFHYLIHSLQPGPNILTILKKVIFFKKLADENIVCTKFSMWKESGAISTLQSYYPWDLEQGRISLTRH